MKVSPVYVRNLESTKRIRANQGSARSGKTYSILQALITLAHKERGEVFTIVRKSFNTLRGTAMRDFFDILNEYDLYDIRKHNRTEHTYEMNSNLLEFVGLDDPKKKRGSKRKHLFINEVNELAYEDWKQLILRTTGLVFIDYNPSDEFHWIYDRVLTRADCEYIHSTYIDNYDFLEKQIVEEIERLKDDDAEAWQIYGLGERTASGERIYTKWDYNFRDAYEDMIFGLDFGFNNPTALTEIGFIDEELHLRQKIYERKLTNSALIDRMNDLKIPKNVPMYADNAEPNRIDEIAEAGFMIFPADKSVKDGIDFVKRYKMHVEEQSSGDIVKELKFYKWKVDRQENITDEPVKFNDHAVDSIRYGVYTHRKQTEAVGIDWIGYEKT